MTCTCDNPDVVFIEIGGNKAAVCDVHGLHSVNNNIEDLK